jgi:hypothetical protein
MATRIPQNKGKNEILQMIQGKTIIEMDEVAGRSLETLHNLYYIPEANIYASANNILRRLPMETISKNVQYLNENSMPQIKHLSDKSLQAIFGSLPPYYSNITPTRITSLNDFDFNLLTPSYPSLDLPQPPSALPYLNKGVTLEEIKENIPKLLAKIENNRSIYSEQMRILRSEESSPLEKIKAVTELIKIKFFIYSGLGGIETVYKQELINQQFLTTPIAYRYTDIVSYHSFLEEYAIGMNLAGWKKRERLTDDSKELVFARAVSGLFLFLVLQISPKDITSRANQNTFFDFFETYLFSFGFVTFDMIPFRKQMEMIAEILNPYVGFDFLVVDCEPEFDETERCGRGVVMIDDNKRGTYRIIVTNVNEGATITLENQSRLLGKYSTNAEGAEGGKRRTRKQKQKKRKSSNKRKTNNLEENKIDITMR